MKPYTATILALAAGFASVNIAAQEPKEEILDLTPFSRLDVKGCFETTLSPGTPERVVVRATAEQHALISTVQAKDVVTIEPMSGGRALCRGEPVEVHVTANFAKDARVDLRMDGSGDFEANVPSVEELKVSAAGAGDLRLSGSAVKCEIALEGSGETRAQSLVCDKELELELRGSGDASLRGETKKCSFDIKGSGDVDAGDYACDAATVKINGSGSLDLPRVKELDVEIRGSGDVNYRGEPDRRRTDVKGSGKVSQR